METLFFFGTLRDREILETVLGRPVDDRTIRPAFAADRQARCFEHEPYPYLATVPGECAEGIAVSDLSEDDISKLSYFEETEYGLLSIGVEIDGVGHSVRYFAQTDDLPETDEPWDFERWQREERAVALEAAEELMAHRGIVPFEGVDPIWNGIKIRARARARAKAARPVTGTLRCARAPGDVQSERVERPYTGHFAIEQHTLRHRQFDGSMSPSIGRTVLASGDAVTIVPYDPRSDSVMLIEQFRAPVFARGDACPWVIETIAGRIDQEMDAETCARREAGEEGGIDLGTVEKIAEFYATPGFAAEHVTSFVGQAALTGEGGIYGVEQENEDIRAFTCALDIALKCVASGEINTAPAIMTLLWLQQHRGRLQAEWT